MLLGTDRLSGPAQPAIDDTGDDLHVDAVTFHEIDQKVRLGTWDEMASCAEDLISQSCVSPSQVPALDGSICTRAGTMNRDPFDRLIAVTALADGLPLVSADNHVDGIVARIW